MLRLPGWSLLRWLSQRSANYPLLGRGKQAIPCREFLAPYLPPKPLARCRCGKRPYGFEFLGIFPPDLMNRKGVLQIQPELLGGPEVFGQASRHFGGNSPLLPNNVVDGGRRDMQFHRQTVSGDAHRLQKFLTENFSRMHRPTRRTFILDAHNFPRKTISGNPLPPRRRHRRRARRNTRGIDR